MRHEMSGARGAVRAVIRRLFFDRVCGASGHGLAA